MKTTKKVTIRINRNETGCTATVNGVKVGWVTTWFNNTFAACVVFGIRTRKELNMPELDLAGYDRAQQGFIKESNAVHYLCDIIRDYFDDHGIIAEIEPY